MWGRQGRWAETQGRTAHGTLQASSLQLPTGKVPNSKWFQQKNAVSWAPLLKTQETVSSGMAGTRCLNNFAMLSQHWLCFQADSSGRFSSPGREDILQCGLTSQEPRTTPSSLIPSTRHVVPQVPCKSPGTRLSLASSGPCLVRPACILGLPRIHRLGSTPCDSTWFPKKPRVPHGHASDVP